MDKLIRISGDHRKMSEMSSMYKEVLSNVKFLNPLDYIDSLNSIFRDTVIPHFEFEEKEIFPIFSSGADMNMKIQVSRLQDEHRSLKEELYQLNEFKSRLGSKPAEEEKEKMLELCSNLARRLNEHASKEDAVIYPLLKEIDSK